MPVTARYLKLMCPQGKPNVDLDGKGRVTCRTLPDESGDQSQALGFAVASGRAGSKWLRIGAVAAAMVLMTGGVTGCSHSNSTPDASASPAPTASASPTPAPVAQATPNLQPTPTPAHIILPIRVPTPAVAGLDSSRLAGVWRNDDPRVKDSNFELRIVQEGKQVYVKGCDPTRCFDNFVLPMQLTANDSAVLNFGDQDRARYQVDAAGRLIVLTDKRDPKTGVWSVANTASYHKAG